jgi:tripartite-type tricarboxylate transporter receptor subunit TctC
MKRKHALIVCIAAGMSAMSGAAQDFPSRLVRIVAPSPGGGGDFVARLVAQGLTPALGQQVIVENRSGGVIQGEVVARAPPDGHTLLMSGSGLWLMPFMRSQVPFDPVRDFAPVTLVVISPNVLVVHPSLPVKTVRDLIALAKAQRGKLNYSAGITGSSPHLAAELFKLMTGVDIVRIAYKSTTTAMSDMIAGQVHLSFANASNVAPHIKAGRLRAVAVTSAQPTKLLPGLPTVASAGLAGFESVAVYGLLAPARTPAAAIARIQQETLRVINTPAIQDKFFSAGVETVGSSPEAFAALIRNDMEKTGKLIREVGIRED